MAQSRGRCPRQSIAVRALHPRGGAGSPRCGATRVLPRRWVMKTYRVAVIPGDGIGHEVVPEGIRVLEAAGRRFGIAFIWDQLDWGCGHYRQHGRMMPEDGLARIGSHDAIFLGAVGWPGVPD